MCYLKGGDEPKENYCLTETVSQLLGQNESKNNQDNHNIHLERRSLSAKTFSCMFKLLLFQT